MLSAAVVIGGLKVKMYLFEIRVVGIKNSETLLYPLFQKLNMVVLCILVELFFESHDLVMKLVPDNKTTTTTTTAAT